MKLSARNQFKGTIVDIPFGTQNSARGSVQ